MFLGQLPQSKNCPPPPYTPGGQFFLGAIAWLPPTLKLTLTLSQTPILITGGGVGGNIPDTSLNKISVFCLLIADYDNKKPEN